MAGEEEVRVVARGGSPDRRRRGRAAAIAAAVLGALVVGVLAGRLTAPDDTARPPAGPSVREPGPTRSVDGVPVGYARTREGAAAALLNYGVVLSRLLLEPPAERRVALRVLGTPDFAATTERTLARAREAAEQGPLGPALRGEATAVYRGGPLGYRVTRFNPDEAVVDTWAFGLAATTSGLAPRMAFQTTTTTLVWRDGDWKLAASDSRPGPAPSVDPDQHVSGRAFVEGVGQLRELRYAP